MSKDLVVISGVNLVDGGPVSVYHDFLKTIIACKYHERFRVLALVGKKKLFEEFENDIELMEFPRAKRSWMNRLYYEYVYFAGMSKRMGVKVWISLHDITPNVSAEYRYVYCHNPSPFNRMKLRDARYGFKYYLFSKLYKYLYAINIRKNDAVIVQQDWMRREFVKLYGLSEVIVARPTSPEPGEMGSRGKAGETVFVFPSFPRYYKNFQTACEAAVILNKEGIYNFKLYITLDGTENKYSADLKRRYHHCGSLIFCGLLSRKRLYELYGQSSCLLFMSRLETWGMPISEYKTTGKPMIVSDLPYAHETVGTWDRVAFVNPDRALDLAYKMKEVIQTGSLSTNSFMAEPEAPFANDWKELCGLLFDG